MPTHIALLRAINVGGTGKLPMAELRALCESIGFTNVRTYIQSGNVVFESRLCAVRARRALEDALERRLGKRHAALLRSVDELVEVETRNPFRDADPKRVLVVFLDDAPPRTVMKGVKIPGREQLHLDGRELFIHFPDGMGTSKLKVPLADQGTGRNLNTVRALLELAAP
ncbi:DUF1697 domain-containing protein [Pseudogemmatithrix spongiicola]|uniref:DUF1697 domain-containing protein n=1 Tax=Pseudogemmatithrix spongiicola TaxID=3062599 RepID=A0AA49JVD5_9BACT|nr:DUF1697 domain-containing protein [Gemmatimonadaceae bacterium 'strain 138']WKW15634.1 DUF1697 domain-containing protein [Gemmatimonadaceae bacterium 'strain 318']